VGRQGSSRPGNAILGWRRSVDAGTIPRVIFTRPEVAAVGAGAGGISGKRGVTTRTIRHSGVDRAIIDRRTDGFTRLFLDRSGRIVGGVIVGPRESLAEVVLAIRHRMRAGDIGAAMHAYPTYGDGRLEGRDRRGPSTAAAADDPPRDRVDRPSPSALAPLTPPLGIGDIGRHRSGQWGEHPAAQRNCSIADSVAAFRSGLPGPRSGSRTSRSHRRGR